MAEEHERVRALFDKQAPSCPALPRSRFESMLCSARFVSRHG